MSSLSSEELNQQKILKALNTSKFNFSFSECFSRGFDSTECKRQFMIIRDKYTEELDQPAIQQRIQEYNEYTIEEENKIRSGDIRLTSSNFNYTNCYDRGFNQEQCNRLATATYETYNKQQIEMEQLTIDAENKLRSGEIILNSNEFNYNVCYNRGFNKEQCDRLAIATSEAYNKQQLDNIRRKEELENLALAEEERLKNSYITKDEYINNFNYNKCYEKGFNYDQCTRQFIIIRDKYSEQLAEENRIRNEQQRIQYLNQIAIDEENKIRSGQLILTSSEFDYKKCYDIGLNEEQCNRLAIATRDIYNQQQLEIEKLALAEEERLKGTYITSDDYYNFNYNKCYSKGFNYDQCTRQFIIIRDKYNEQEAQEEKLRLEKQRIEYLKNLTIEEENKIRSGQVILASNEFDYKACYDKGLNEDQCNHLANVTKEVYNNQQLEIEKLALAEEERLKGSYITKDDYDNNFNYTKCYEKGFNYDQCTRQFIIIRDKYKQQVEEENKLFLEEKRKEDLKNLAMEEEDKIRSGNVILASNEFDYKSCYDKGFNEEQCNSLANATSDIYNQQQIEKAKREADIEKLALEEEERLKGIYITKDNYDNNLNYDKCYEKGFNYDQCTRQFTIIKDKYEQQVEEENKVFLEEKRIEDLKNLAIEEENKIRSGQVILASNEFDYKSCYDKGFNEEQCNSLANATKEVYNNQQLEKAKREADIEKLALDEEETLKSSYITDEQYINNFNYNKCYEKGFNYDQCTRQFTIIKDKYEQQVADENRLLVIKEENEIADAQEKAAEEIKKTALEEQKEKELAEQEEKKLEEAKTILLMQEQLKEQVEKDAKILSDAQEKSTEEQGNGIMLAEAKSNALDNVQSITEAAKETKDLIDKQVKTIAEIKEREKEQSQAKEEAVNDLRMLSLHYLKTNSDIKRKVISQQTIQKEEPKELPKNISNINKKNNNTLKNSDDKKILSNIIKYSIIALLILIIIYFIIK
jgi:hypothetical protein